MRRSFNLCIAAVIAYVVLVSALIVFPSNNNLLLLNISNQIAHATTVSKYNYTGIDPTTRAFLEKTDTGPPIYTLTPQKARAVLNGLPADIENRTIPGGPNGTKVSITIVRPPNTSNETLPVVIYTHGGGWVLGGFNTHDRLVREIANKAHVAVVFVNYTPSPEAKYPVALEQAYAATKWVA